MSLVYLPHLNFGRQTPHLLFITVGDTNFSGFSDSTSRSMYEVTWQLCAAFALRYRLCTSRRKHEIATETRKGLVEPASRIMMCSPRGRTILTLYSDYPDIGFSMWTNDGEDIGNGGIHFDHSYVTVRMFRGYFAHSLVVPLRWLPESCLQIGRRRV